MEYDRCSPTCGLGNHFSSIVILSRITFREMILKNSFSGTKETRTRGLKRNRYGPSISSKRIVGIFPKDRTSFFPSKEPSSIFFPSDMIILSRRQNGKSAFLNRNPLLRDKPIDGHRRYSRIIIYRKFNVTSRWPLFPLARSSSRIDRLIQANPAVPINFYKANDKEI